MSEPLDALAGDVKAAQGGDAGALDRVVRAVQNDVYRLAQRMLYLPADAEDATQEILVRVVTRLGSFEGRSRFRTWVYRVAANHLLDFRRARAEHGLSFDEYGEDLADGLTTEAPQHLRAPELQVLRREVRLACTSALLMCLDRDHRLAYVLGVVFELAGPEAASILGIAPAAFRKRLSRAQQRVHAFLQTTCGRVAPDRAACRCEHRIDAAVAQGRVDPEQLLFSQHPVAPGDGGVDAVVSRLERAVDATTLMRAHPSYVANDEVADGVLGLLRRSES